MHSNSGRAANAEPARPLRPKLALMRSLAGGAVIALAACAATIASVGRAATAPVLDGCGWQTLASKSPSAKADALFQQGVAQADAFNEVEAVRMFKAALGADPACAMCAWGVAWQLGPNINDTERGDFAKARG